MSEPMSTFEIEDVLSSIRRLVSEDLRPTHKLVSAALQNGAAKLILTPALRVVSNEAPGFVHSADDLDDPGDLQSVLDNAESIESAEAADLVPMFGSVRLQEMADVQAEGWPAEGEGQAAEANFLASAMSRINVLAASDTATPAPPETIERVVAAVGAAVGPDEWEVDGGDPAPHAESWADSVWHSTDAAQTLLLLEPADTFDEEIDSFGGSDASNVAMAELTDVAAIDSFGGNDASSVEVAELTDVAAIDRFGSSDASSVEVAELSDVAAVTAAVEVAELTEVAAVTADVASDICDQTILDTSFDDQNRVLMGQDSIVFHDDVSAQAKPAETQGDVAATVEQFDNDEVDATDAMDESAGFLNEDMLRDIVRDMVQAELQGALGERITRNVRKLVRSEISRALASRDFD